MIVKIGLVGDYSESVAAHAAIPQALRLAAADLNAKVEIAWLPTETIAAESVNLSDFDGLWCVPASPYDSMDGALAAIRFARERNVPFLGTCGGFQHALIEYARNVLEIAAADNVETNSATTMPLISPLACSLVEKNGTIKLKRDSQINRIYGADEIVEQYHCNYGVNPQYQSLLEAGELKITGVDGEGEARAVELGGHRFFIGTLFQPERSALRSGAVHPLVRAYLQAAAAFCEYGKIAV